MTDTLPASPALASAQKLLADAKLRLRNWSLSQVLPTFLFMSRPGIREMLTKSLGPCTSSQDFEGQEWAVWATNAYTLYATDTYLDLDTEVRGLEGALTALQWDLGMGQHLIPRAEHEALVEQGRVEGLKVKYDIPGQSQEDLKRFVRDYCDGQILCDHQVREASILGMVFMPLALGAFSIKAPKEGEEPSPEYLAEKALTKDIGKEPVLKDPPTPPAKPPYPPKPEKPKDWKEPDAEQIKVIEDDIRWNVSSPERLENYLEEIRLHNVGVDYHRAQVLLDWEAAKTVIDQAHEQALAEHQKVLQGQEPARRRFKAKHLKWKQKQARQNTLLGGFSQGRMSDLGVIYEEYGKAGPRAVNGYPIFWSFRILNRSDWERARKVIIQEIQRREDMEV